MFDGRRSRRGCLLPIVVALVVAMVGVFGSASTSATAESEETTTLKVTGVEKGVIGTAYKYINLKDESTDPEQQFPSDVAGFVKITFAGKEYVDDSSNKPGEKFKEMESEDRCNFADKLLGAIANGSFTLQQYASTSGGGGGISFTLPRGGYVIKLSNGSSQIYDPILAYVWPKDGALHVRENFDPSAVSTIGAKSKETITSTKTVNNKQKTHGQISDTNSLTYQIKTPIPKYPANATNKHFGVQDHPNLGLNLNPSSIKVRIEEEKEELSNRTDYSYDIVDAEDGRDGGFQIKFDTQQYTSKLASKAGKTLVVTYNGALNDKAAIKNGTHNRAHPLITEDNYNPDPKAVKYTAPPSAPATTTVYTYGVRFTKVDSGDKDTRLKDAQFELHTNGGKVHVKGKPPSAKGMYVVHDSSGGSSTITSNENGVVQIDGLNAGVTYTLQETKPPTGYDTPTAPITIMICDEKTEKLDGKPEGSSNEPDGIPDTNGTMIDGESIGESVKLGDDNRLTYEIKNTKTKPAVPEYDFTLPKTGAMGTAVFSVLGVALVATSGALVAVICRRKSKRSS